MDNETIYTVLLDQPRRNGENTMHGFSYRLDRKYNGKITLKEIGANELVLWESDGPELETLDEATVKQMIEAALPVDADYVIPPPPVPFVPTYTPEAWTSMYFSPMQVSALQRFEFALGQAGKPLGPLMTALKAWMEGMLVASVDPTPRSDWQQPPCSYEAASAEAVAGLSSPNPET